MTLKKLLAAHKALADEFPTASALLAKIESDYEVSAEANPVTVRIGLANFGAFQGADYLHGVADDVCDRLVRDQQTLAALSPDFAAVVREGVAKIRAELRLAIEAALVEEEARQEAFGLAAARRNWERLDQAEREALRAICLYRCATIEDEQARLLYLLAAETFRNDWAAVRDCADALLKSTAVPATA